jgi:hypothetical protein
MTFVQTIERKVQAASGGVVAREIFSEVTENEVRVKFNVATGQTDEAHTTATIKVASLKSFGLSSNFEVTVKTNNSATPDNTYIIGPTSGAKIWRTGEAAPPSANINTLYVTNASGSLATIILIAGF